MNVNTRSSYCVPSALLSVLSHGQEKLIQGKSSIGLLLHPSLHLHLHEHHDDVVETALTSYMALNTYMALASYMATSCGACCEQS